MNPEFVIKEVEAQAIVGIRMSVELAKIAEVMGQLFPEVYGYVLSQGQSPTGMPLTPLPLHGR